MKRPVALWLLLALLGLLACSKQTGAGAGKGLHGAATGWDLLLVSVDTLRADRLGAYGYDQRATSPALDALFASGVGFARTTAPRALTWPSLATVLTGQYPSGHGLLGNGYSFAEDQVTLPKLLRRAGYTTGAFVNNMIRANHQGWDLFNSAGGMDNRLNSRAVDWVGGLDGSAPHFLWVHYFGAHAPYRTAGRFATQLLDPDYEGPVQRGKKALAQITGEGVQLSEADLKQLNAVYDSAVMGTDRRVGLLLQALREAGEMERTVVVFLGDHGEDLYEHNQYIFHSCSAYESALRVPLAFSAPGLIVGGGMVSQPTELADVMPTVLDLLGLEVPEEVQGVSLVPYLERPRRGGEGRPAFSEYGESRIHTVISGNWKLIANPDGYRPECLAGFPDYAYEIEPVELYNLADDPNERVNLAASHPRRVAELEALIQARFATLVEGREGQELPEDLKEELRALGYVAN